MTTTYSSGVLRSWKCGKCFYNNNTRETCYICHSPRVSVPASSPTGSDYYYRSSYSYPTSNGTTSSAYEFSSPRTPESYCHTSRLELFPDTRYGSPGTQLQSPRCSCCFARDKLSLLEACACKVCDKCLEPTLRLRLHAPFVSSFRLYCPGCRVELADSDLLALFGEEGYKDAQGNVFDALERHVVELGRKLSYSPDDNFRKGVEMCRSLLMIENALHNDRLQTLVEQGMQDLHREFSHVRKARDMRASKGGSVMDFITSALVFRGGLNKLLRVWLVRAHCILKREISVDYIDERLLELVTEISNSRTLLPCLIEPVSVTYAPPVSHSSKSALAELLREPQSVYSDLKQLKKLMLGRYGHSSLQPGGSSLKWYCEQLSDTFESVKVAVRVSGLDLYSSVSKEPQNGGDLHGTDKTPTYAHAWTSTPTPLPKPDAEVNRSQYGLGNGEVSEQARESTTKASSEPITDSYESQTGRVEGKIQQYTPAKPMAEGASLSPEHSPGQDGSWLGHRMEVTSRDQSQAFGTLRDSCASNEGKSSRPEPRQDADNTRLVSITGQPLRSTLAEILSLSPQACKGAGCSRLEFDTVQPSRCLGAWAERPGTSVERGPEEDGLSTAQHSSAPGRVDSADLGETDLLFQRMLLDQVPPSDAHGQEFPSCDSDPTSNGYARGSSHSQPKSTSPAPRRIPFSGSDANGCHSPPAHSGATRADSVNSIEREMLNEAIRISLPKLEDGSATPGYPLPRSSSSESVGGTPGATQLVGKRRPLQETFSGVGAELVRRLRQILPRYPQWRSIYGDGNCFYRAFLFTLLEGLMDNIQQAAAVHRRTERLKDKLMSTSFREEGWEGGAFLLEGVTSLFLFVDFWRTCRAPSSTEIFCLPLSATDALRCFLREDDDVQFGERNERSRYRQPDDTVFAPADQLGDASPPPALPGLHP